MLLRGRLSQCCRHIELSCQSKKKCICILYIKYRNAAAGSCDAGICARHTVLPVQPPPPPKKNCSHILYAETLLRGRATQVYAPHRAVLHISTLSLSLSLSHTHTHTQHTARACMMTCILARIMRFKLCGAFSHIPTSDKSRLNASSRSCQHTSAAVSSRQQVFAHSRKRREQIERHVAMFLLKKGANIYIYIILYYIIYIFG